MCMYDISYETEEIVKQLTQVLDYLDEMYSQFDSKNTYTTLVADCSLCLAEKCNRRIVQYCYIIDRYKTNDNCLKILLESYYKDQAKRVRPHSFESHFC